MTRRSLLRRLTSFLSRSEAVTHFPARRAARMSVEQLEPRDVPAFLTPVPTSIDSTLYSSVVAADFNGDGLSDRAIQRDSAGFVAVQLNTGNGTFGPVQNFAAGVNSFGYQQAITAGDFNGDGTCDLATANSDGVSVLPGNGNGTFAAPRNLVLPDAAMATSLTTGDLNGDGKLDLAVGGDTFSGDPNRSQFLYVLLGNGNGTFATPSSSLLPADADLYASPSTVRLGDLNGDGRLDAVVARGYNSVNVLQGTGDGTMGPVAVYSTSPTPEFWWSRSVAIGDLNADGHLDLVAADFNGTAVSVMPGNGSGTFATVQKYSVGSNPSSVQVADVNSDGRLDIVTANYGSGDVSVLRGLTGGTFASVRNFPANSSPYSLAVGNFNGDSFPDVTVTNAEGGQSVSTLLNDGNWTTFGTPSIRISDVTKAEGKRGTTYFSFTVTLSFSTDVPVTVQYATANGTAKATEDYVATSGTLSFAPGETTRSIVVAVKGDSKKEANETFFVRLSMAVNALLVDPEGVGTIYNDD